MRARSYAVTTTIAAALIALSACGTADTSRPATTAEIWGTEPAASCDGANAAAGNCGANITPPASEQPSVDIQCYDADSNPVPGLQITGDEPDFATTWNDHAVSCEAQRNDAPFSDREQAAYDKSGYGDNSVDTLYAICAARGDEVYTDPTYAASTDQIAEIRGMLTLCPDHPDAAKLRAAVQRGLRDIEMRKNGEIFGEGVHLVGKEIQPGTYVTQGELDGCYWERTDDAGEIIDNNFINAARRAEVTISSSDYSFSSENCGEWRAE